MFKICDLIYCCGSFQFSSRIFPFLGFISRYIALSKGGFGVAYFESPILKCYLEAGTSDGEDGWKKLDFVITGC